MVYAGNGKGRGEDLWEGKKVHVGMEDGQCRQMVYVGRVEGLYVWRRGG